jgi:hypothetical protein
MDPHSIAGRRYENLHHLEPYIFAAAICYATEDVTSDITTASDEQQAVDKVLATLQNITGRRARDPLGFFDLMNTFTMDVKLSHRLACIKGEVKNAVDTMYGSHEKFRWQERGAALVTLSPHSKEMHIPLSRTYLAMLLQNALEQEAASGGNFALSLRIRQSDASAHVRRQGLTFEFLKGDWWERFFVFLCKYHRGKPFYIDLSVPETGKWKYLQDRVEYQLSFQRFIVGCCTRVAGRSPPAADAFDDMMTRLAQLAPAHYVSRRMPDMPPVKQILSSVATPFVLLTPETMTVRKMPLPAEPENAPSVIGSHGCLLKITYAEFHKAHAPLPPRRCPPVTAMGTLPVMR